MDIWELSLAHIPGRGTVINFTAVHGNTCRMQWASPVYVLILTAASTATVTASSSAAASTVAAASRA